MSPASLTSAPLVVGAQRPRILAVPEYSSSSGAEAVELARLAGLNLDPWQELVLEHSLGERPDGRWAAFEVGLVVPRQNGKDAILEARELAGLFLLGEKLLVHSAHQFDTSLEHFRRLLFLIENTPEFDRRVQRVSRSHGEEGIELKGGQRIRFRTRTKGGGRGFTGDFLALNEAMELPEAAIGALMPTLATRPNAQVWYTGSPVDQQIHDHGVVLARVRERGIRGDDPRLAYFECSVDAGNPDDVPVSVATDPEAWAQGNPALGIRITAEHIANEQRSMGRRTFAVERLGVGDWPATDGGTQVISDDVWNPLEDLDSKITGPLCFSYDVTPDRAWASIGVSGRRDDGRQHIEVVERRKGTAWVAERLADLCEAHNPLGVVADLGGPAGSLAPDLEELDIEITPVSAKEHAQACGRFFDAAHEAEIAHLGTDELAAAIKGAVKRTLGDAWAWSRKSSATDISPLVAVTLAHWGAETLSPPEPFVAWAAR